MLMAFGAQGIIRFSSLHTALALILIVALWSLPVLRLITIGLYQAQYRYDDPGPDRGLALFR